MRFFWLFAIYSSAAAAVKLIAIPSEQVEDLQLFGTVLNATTDSASRPHLRIIKSPQGSSASILDTSTNELVVLRASCSGVISTCVNTQPLSQSQSIDLLKTTLKALSYNNAMLLTGHRCSWLDVEAEVRSLLLNKNEEPLEVHAHGFGAKLDVNCGDLEHTKYSIYWLLPTSLDEAVLSLLDLYQAGGLTARHWMIYADTWSGVSLSKIMAALNTTLAGAKVAQWIKRHTLVISSFPSTATLQQRLAHLNLTAEVLRAAIASPSLLRSVDRIQYGLQVLNTVLGTNQRVESQDHNLSHVRVALSWTGVSFEQADHYLRTLSTGNFSQTRAKIGVREDGFEYQFYDPDGHFASRPYLMLDGNPELYPVDSLPVKLPLLTAFARTHPGIASASPAVTAFVMAATEFFNTQHASTLEISMALRNAFPNQCTPVAESTLAGPFVGVLGAIFSECSINMMEVFRRSTMPCISPGSTSPLLSNITRYGSFYRVSPSSSRFGAGMARLIAATPFRCVVTISENTGLANREVLRSLLQDLPDLGINVAGQFVLPADPTDIGGIRALLENVWNQGIGVIVVNTERVHAGALMETANELGMLDVDFLWVLSAFASIPAVFSESVARKLTGRMLTLKTGAPTLTTPLGQAYADYKSSWSHQTYFDLAASQGYTIRATEAVNLYTQAALHQMHTYGFGTDINLTRRALLKGIQRLTQTAVPAITASVLTFRDDQTAELELTAFTMQDGFLVPIGSIGGAVAALNASLWTSAPFSCQAPGRSILSTTTVEPAMQRDALSRGFLAVISTIVLMTILVLAMLFIVRRRANDPDYRAYDFKPLVDMLTLKMRLDHHGVTPTELPRRVVKYDTDKRLGKGKFGTVYAGLVKERGEVRQVAVKVLRGDATSASAHQLRTEAVLLSQFESQEHIVNAIGVVTVGAPMLLVMELCNQGSLHDYLNEQFSKNITVSWTEKLALCRQVAEGMQALAAANCIHTDLAARNILVHEGVAKVCDFGLSKSSHYYMSQSDRPVPVRWTAPEALDGYFSTPGDVWSFGVLMWEVAVNAQSLPYPSMGNQEVMQAVRNGYRLKCPLLCPQPIYHIMLSCWAEVDRRPTFAQLCRGLEGLSTVNYDNQNVEQEVVNRSRSMTAAPDLHSFHIHLPTAGAPSAEPAVHGQKRSGYVPRDQLSRDQYLARNQAERKKLVERRDYDRLTVL